MMEPNLSHSVHAAKDFFDTMRSYEAFRKGLDCPLEHRLPCGASRPYGLNVSDLLKEPGETTFENARVPPHRWFATLRIALKWRTALGSNLLTVAGLMLVSSTYMAFMSFAAQMMPYRVYWALALFTKETGALVSSLQTAVAMLLSFYSLERVNWFWSMMRQGFIVQGRIHDIAMLCGAATGNTEEEWLARYVLYRHLTLAFFFTYQPLTPSFKFVGFGPLRSCGLLTEDEELVLQKAHSMPRTVVESWLARWVQAYVPDDANRQQVFLSLRELRSASAGVGDLVVQRAPVSFESLLYVAVYALCLLLPFGPSQIDYENRSAVMTAAHLAIPLGDGVLIAFYLSLLHLLHHMQAPFDSIGAPHDCLNPIAIMNTTERKCRDYLSSPPPDTLLAPPGMRPTSQRDPRFPSRRVVQA